jgi:hypothetical protein
MKIMSYVFWRVSSSIKLRPEKKGTVVWPSVGMFGGSISSDCFSGFLNQIMTEKKGTVVWPSVAMSGCFGGFVAMFFGRFLNQITNYDQKKRYSRLACLHHLQHTEHFIFTMFVLKTRKYT